jgi:hypothetical protein
MDEFAGEATAIFAAIIGLLILLTYLERSLLQPHRRQRPGSQRSRLRRQREASADPEPPDPVD